MKFCLIGLPASIVVLGLAGAVGAEELGNFGALPNPGSDWKVERKGALPDATAWSWVTLRNSKTGDLLSFASHVPRSGEPSKLINHSDTAHEIFSADGYCASDPEAKSTAQDIYPIRNGITTLGVTDGLTKTNVSKEALEYTYVEEGKDGAPNRMAHGYVLLFDGVAVYVQHTSLKPITDEIAQGVATDLVYLEFENQARKRSEATAAQAAGESGTSAAPAASAASRPK